jgi:hypothetical protein
VQLRSYFYFRLGDGNQKLYLSGRDHFLPGALRETSGKKIEAAVTERIVAVALVTEAELQLLGEGFNRAFPVDEAPCFGGLLQAIDEADRAFSATLRRDD